MSKQLDTVLRKNITFDAYVVHEGFNLNGHYFPREELEKSFDSFKDTPLNIEHNADVVVGNINKASWIDEDNAVIVNATVLYPMLEQVVEEADLVVAKIESSRYQLSMECVPGDVAIILQDTHTQKQEVIPLDDSTAFLLSFIPQFGGEGIVANHYIIGLYLKDITFVGAALTETPADPYAKIIQLYHSKKMVAKTEVNEMDELKAQIKSLEADIKTLQAEKEQLEKDQKASADEIEKLNKAIEDKEAEIASLKETIADFEQKVQEFEAKVKELEDAKANVEAELKEAVEAKEKVEEELKASKQELLLIERKDKIKAFNVDIEDEKLLAFDDNQFDVFVDSLKIVAETKKEEVIEVKTAQFKAEDQEDGMPTGNDDSDIGHQILNCLNGK